MKPIKTFVINLEKATLRRKYMETLLSGYNILARLYTLMYQGFRKILICSRQSKQPTNSALVA